MRGVCSTSIFVGRVAFAMFQPPYATNKTVRAGGGSCNSAFKKRAMTLAGLNVSSNQWLVDPWPDNKTAGHAFYKRPHCVVACCYIMPSHPALQLANAERPQEPIGRSMLELWHQTPQCVSRNAPDRIPCHMSCCNRVHCSKSSARTRKC